MIVEEVSEGVMKFQCDLCGSYWNTERESDKHICLKIEVK